MNATCHRRTQAFTLVEMLTVITVILILAAILLNVAGYVNNKAAHSRAQAEIEQFKTALEGYKADSGIYAPTGGAALYQALTGDGNSLLGGTVASQGENPANSKLLPNLGMQGKNYLSALKTSQIINSGGWQLADPWGKAYFYIQPGTHNAGGYDIYSDAGGKIIKDAGGTVVDSTWVKNW